MRWIQVLPYGQRRLSAGYLPNADADPGSNRYAYSLRYFRPYDPTRRSAAKFSTNSDTCTMAHRHNPQPDAHAHADPHSLCS